MDTIKINPGKEGDSNIIDDKLNKADNGNTIDDVFDVAIIGGGYSGLSAALLLGRYLRPTIIFDVMQSRKSIIHGYLGFEKTPREDVIQKAWKDVLQYHSVKRIEKKVEKVEKDYDNNFFLITTATTKENGKDDDMSKSRKARAKYLIIATGVEHVKPDIQNFEEFYGNGVWHCPHCDGFEATNKKLAIIASDNKNNEAIKYAKTFLGWTKDVKLFFQRPLNQNNGDEISYALTEEQRNEAMALGIDLIENDELVKIIGNSNTNAIEGVVSKSNKRYEADVLFYHLGQIIHNELANQLGCEFDEGYLKVDEKQQTTVPNVFAVGDIDTDRHYAILAAASGALAAIHIYEGLLKDAIKITKVESNT
ncbi:MAG: NAD(P)/FAD-dependent oxidoreductase [Nitrosopumilus sp.]|nr:NAD(P)/FAD-dependent oxidoreductase [Nitrosopumilus sp.]